MLGMLVAVAKILAVKPGTFICPVLFMPAISTLFVLKDFFLTNIPHAMCYSKIYMGRSCYDKYIGFDAKSPFEISGVNEPLV
jgi:hypothetical protein